jgi:hypothetical protein
MNLNEQMIRDYGLYLEPDYIESFKRNREEERPVFGDVAMIEDTYDGEDLIDRLYKFAIGGGMVLEGIRASEDNTLNKLLGLETAPLTLKEVKQKGELTVKTYVSV